MAKSKTDKAVEAIEDILADLVDEDGRNKQSTTADQEKRDEASALRSAIEHVERAAEARRHGNERRENERGSLSHDEKQRARGVTDPLQAGNPDKE